MPANYYHHAIARMKQKGITPTQVEDTIVNPTSVLDQPNGNQLYTGRSGTAVVIDPEGWVVTVLVPDR